MNANEAREIGQMSPDPLLGWGLGTRLPTGANNVYVATYGYMSHWSHEPPVT